MKLSRALSLITLFGCFVFSAGAFAVIDINAAVVQLRDPANGGCSEAGAPLNNCFTDAGTLADWISLTRNPTPSSTAPLLVKIGPGNFGQFYCGTGLLTGIYSNITYQGSGMGQTKMASITITNCTDLFFSDMTFTGAGGGAGYAIALIRGGPNTTWTNVEVLGPSAWSEYVCGSKRGKHYWFNSHISSSNGFGTTVAYKASCDESWFLGTEITAIETSNQLNKLSAIQVSGTGEVHVYGSVIRALNNGTGVATGTNHSAVSVTGPGSMHIHGAGIDAISNSASTVVALYAANGGTIHANGASYNMSTGAGGKVTRILNQGGHVHAPYQWEEHPTPPNIVSVTGADMAVQTNCAATGCQMAGTETHLLIYNSNCTGIGGPWFDVVTRACR